MSAFNPRGIAFATKTSAAAMIALLLALSFNLTNPGWAVLTVFLTSQQLEGAAGAVIGRSFHRLLGTLLGAAGALFVIPACSIAPELLLLGVASWVGLCLYVSLLDRRPRSYVFLLAAYTLPLIGMPSANNPSAVFDVVLWRTEEIMLGAAVSMAVHSVFAARSIKPLLVAKMRAAVDGARRWISKGLGPNPADEAEQRARERLAADLAEASMLADHLRFEPSATPRDIAAVNVLEQRLLALLPLLAGIEDRQSAIPTADARSVQVLGAQFDWGQLLALGAKQRLAELQQTWSDCLDLLRLLEDDASVPSDRTRTLLAEASPRPLHVDYALAARSGLAAALTVLAAGGLCWMLGWDQGPAAIGIAAATSSLFAFLDDPRPVQKMLLVIGSVFAIPTAALYVFAIFPAIDGHVALALVVAPLLFFSALYLATPKLGPPALGFAIVWLTLVGFQPVQNGDFWSFTPTAIGVLMGTVIALVVTSLVRVIGPQTRVHGLLRSAWRDLAAIADDTSELSRAAWGSRMVDRIGLLLPRMPGTSGVLRAQAKRALDDLRVGVNMLDLRHAGSTASPQVRTAIDSALKQIGAHFRQRLEQPDIAPAPAIVASIDRAIAGLIESDPGALRDQALTAATGLRLGLFPLGTAPGATP